MTPSRQLKARALVPSAAGARRDNFTFSGRIATLTIDFVRVLRGSATWAVRASGVEPEGRPASLAPAWASNRLVSPPTGALDREAGVSLRTAGLALDCAVRRRHQPVRRPG